MAMHLYRVKTRHGETVLQLTEETAQRDYPSAVRIETNHRPPSPDEKQADAPLNKAAGPPPNKSH